MSMRGSPPWRPRSPTIPREARSTARARVRLAAALAARYVQRGGTDDDRLRAERLGREVLADPDAASEHRRAMSLLLPILTMMAESPAAVLRGHGPVLDADAFGRIGQWQRDVGPAELLAGLGRIAEQLQAVEGVAELPPQIRSILPVMGAMQGLLTDTQRPGWDGRVAPDVTGG